MAYRLDLEKIAKELEFDLEDVEMLLEVFLESVQESLISLKNAIESKDFEAIFKAAHSIKGSAANLLLKDISELAKEIELAGRKEKEIDYQTKYNELSRMIEDIVE